MTDTKPLNWSPTPGIGYTVSRRADGGLNIIFTDLTDATINHWHDFALDHLLGSDRLTRNLYDLRQVAEIPEKAIKLAGDVNNDPSTRNIRLAVLVANSNTRQAIIDIAAGAIGSGAAIRIFTSLEEAETWLGKPLDQIV